MPEAKKFMIDAVPLTRIPLTRNQSFWYLSDVPLPTGTLALAPLFHRSVEVVVIESREDFPRLGNIKLKKINSVIQEGFLDDKQLKLAQFISDYYLSSLGIVLKSFVPKRVKAHSAERLARSLKAKKIILTKEQEIAVDKICKSHSKFLLYGPAASGKTEVYIHSILKLKEKNEKLQFLILVPEKTLTPQAIERYGASFNPNEIAVLSSNVSKGRYWVDWQRIKSGEVKIIIGTRMAVFAPFKKLGLIIIDEEQDMSYKQWDMNPRYDARTAAEKLAEIHKCQIVRGSATPSVETYYRAISKGLKLLILPALNSSFLVLPSIQIIDMRRERWVKNYSCISKKLQSEIAYALKYGLQVILLIGRQGMSVFSVCASCKTVLKCPNCDRALIYDQEGIYHCTHCNYKTSVIPACLKCGAITFKNVGLGTQKVEKEIFELFPAAKVARIDSQAIRKKNYQEKIYKEFSEGKIDILIGTQMITKGWDLPRVSLVGIIDTDNLLSQTDFRGEERAFQNILQVSGRVARPEAKYPGVVILQTFEPQNPVIKLAAAREVEKFYERENKDRRDLNYPPFGKLIKLMCQDKNQKSVDVFSDSAYKMLSAIPDTSITAPYYPILPKIRARFRKQIVIKLKNNQALPEILKKALCSLPNNWVIDIDPISLA